MYEDRISRIRDEARGTGRFQLETQEQQWHMVKRGQMYCKYRGYSGDQPYARRSLRLVLNSRRPTQTHTHTPGTLAGRLHPLRCNYSS